MLCLRELMAKQKGMRIKVQRALEKCWIICFSLALSLAITLGIGVSTVNVDGRADKES